MKAYEHDEVVLEQQLQDHYEQRYGQPPDTAEFWGRLAPQLEARAHPARKWFRLRKALRSGAEAGLRAPERSRVAPSGRLGGLAAFFVACLLVGSLIAVFHLALQKPHTTSSHGSTGNSGIYALTSNGKLGSHSSTINRIDANTHEIVWKQNFNDLASDLAFGEDAIYGVNMGGIYALNLSNGSYRWNIDFASGMLTDPTVSGNALYVMDWSGNIYSLDTKTGKTNWSCNTGLSTVLSSTSGAQRPGSVSVADGVVYNTALNKIVAVDAQKGTVLWSKTVDQSLFFNSPVAVGDSVYVTSHTENDFDEGPVQWSFVYAYDGHTGALKWSYRVDARIVKSEGSPNPVAVSGNLVVFNAPLQNGNTYALDARSGKLVWQAKASYYSNEVQVGDGVVYYEEDSIDGRFTLHALDLASGKKLWDRIFPERFLPGPVKNHLIYAGISPNKIVAFQTSDGKTLWQTDLAGVTSVPEIWYVS